MVFNCCYIKIIPGQNQNIFLYIIVFIVFIDTVFNTHIICNFIDRLRNVINPAVAVNCRKQKVLTAYMLLIYAGVNFIELFSLFSINLNRNGSMSIITSVVLLDKSMNSNSLLFLIFVYVLYDA